MPPVADVNEVFSNVLVTGLILEPVFLDSEALVLIDGKKAIIVKIGITQTVFGVYSPSGYTWRYVPNERISWIKLEKIVNPDLKISKNMLKIDSNHKEIQELKKKINGK